MSISVADFGFLPTATAAVNQAAMHTALATVPHNTRLVVPSGLYHVLPFTIPESTKVLTIQGDGNYDTTFQTPSGTTGYLFNFASGCGQFWRLRNLDLSGNPELTGMVYVGNLGCSLENVRMHGASVGLEIAHSVCAEYRNLFCYGTTAGLWLHPDVANSYVVNKNEFYNIRCALAATGCKIDGGYNSQNNTFIGLDGTHCTTGLSSNGYRNVFVNPWFEQCDHCLTDTDTAASIFVGFHEGPPTGASGSTKGVTSRFLNGADEYVGRSQVQRPPAGVGQTRVYDPANDFAPVIAATAMQDGASSRALCSVVPWSSSFSSIITVRVDQVGTAGYCRAIGTARTTGASPTNTIPQAMTSESASGLGTGTLSWSSASGAATLSYTPDSGTDTTALHVTITQRTGNRVVLEL